MTINSNLDLRIFAKELSEVLLKLGETVLANELTSWYDDFFTTASEFLGELRLILKKIIIIETLDDATKKDVNECIEIIDKAFNTVQ